MHHLLKNGKKITYLHTIYGNLFKMNEPIETMISWVKENPGLTQYLQDSEGKSFLADTNHIDLIFNSSTIWWNNYNEEFFNAIKQMQC